MSEEPQITNDPSGVKEMAREQIHFISKVRIQIYDAEKLKETYGRKISEFLASGHQISK